jgi:hypothetical protein
LARDLLSTTMAGDNDWENDKRMNRRDNSDGMNASQGRRL